MPQSPSIIAGRVLCLAFVPLRPKENSCRGLGQPQIAQGSSGNKLPGLSAPPPLNNVTNRCLQAEVWSKQSLNYNKVSHSAVLIAMKTAIKCVKKGKCFPRRLGEKLQRRGRGVRERTPRGQTVSETAERNKGHGAAADAGKGASSQSGVHSPKTQLEHFWVAGEQM